MKFRLCIFALSYVPHAWAAAPPQLPFEVHAAASAECAPDAFTAKIAQLSQRLRPALPGESSLDLSLQISHKQRTFSGRIRVRELDGNDTTRAVEGATCDEVLSALALIAVVLVDPNAASEPRAPDTARHAESARERRGRTARSARRWRFGAGMGAGIEGAVGPEVVPTGSLQLEAVLGGPGIWSPRVALALNRSAGDTVATPAGSAHFAWTAARVSGCPIRFPSSGRFAVRPCAFMDVGALQVTGEQTYRGATARVTWVSLGGVARAEFTPVAPLSVAIDAGIAAPLVRDRFYFDPGDASETLKVPSVGLTLRAGLAVYFE